MKYNNVKEIILLGSATDIILQNNRKVVKKIFFITQGMFCAIGNAKN